MSLALVMNLFVIIISSFALGFTVAAHIRTWPFHRCDR